VASFEVPGIIEAILLKRGANGRVLVPLERQVISRATSASPAVRPDRPRRKVAQSHQDAADLGRRPSTKRTRKERRAAPRL